jgi:hypothetical protein
LAAIVADALSDIVELLVLSPNLRSGHYSFIERFTSVPYSADFSFASTLSVWRRFIAVNCLSEVQNGRWRAALGADPPFPGRHWLRTAPIAELWRKTGPLSAIGLELGVSRSKIASVIDRARRAGYTRFAPRPTPIHRAWEAECRDKETQPLFEALDDAS